MNATDWDRDLGRLLGDLSAAQDDMLALLTEKQRRLARSDAAGLDSLVDREQEVLDRLQRCHDERQRLLDLAATEGERPNTLRSVSRRFPGENGAEERLQAASAKSRLLYHHSLTNWVVAQRSLLHVSQLLEMLATGGRQRPTYSIDAATDANSTGVGVLIDQTA